MPLFSLLTNTKVDLHEKNRVKDLFAQNNSLRTVPTNSKVVLPGFMNIREKQISTSVIKIEKKIGGNHAFFKDN